MKLYEKSRGWELRAEMDGGETQKRPRPTYSSTATDDDAQMKAFWILT
jgi:hypothetical protein